MRWLREHLSYGNVMATLALFIALGGTSYAVLKVGSDEVLDNSLRSRDIRNSTVRSRDIRDHALRPRDLRRNSLGADVVRESSLGTIPRAADAERVGGATAQDLRLKCPADTAPKAGVCIEIAPRGADGFFGALDRCDQVGRGLVTMPQLDRFARTQGPLAQAEWTGSVYRNTAGSTPGEQLEAVVMNGFGDVSYDQVNKPIQHAFRCVALPSN
jgi:hypothetical protein